MTGSMLGAAEGEDSLMLPAQFPSSGKLMQPPEQSLLGCVLSFGGDCNLWKPVFALLITGPRIRQEVSLTPTSAP